MHAIFLLGLNNVVFAQRHGFDDHVEDSRPEERHVDTDCFQVLAEGGETPLEAKVVMLGLLVLNEVIVLLVDRVVGQMHVPVILVELGRVGLRGKTRQALLVNVQSQRLVTSDHNVDSQVEFVAVD